MWGFCFFAKISGCFLILQIFYCEKEHHFLFNFKARSGIIMDFFPYMENGNEKAGCKAG